jgi:hypothetical protein
MNSERHSAVDAFLDEIGHAPVPAGLARTTMTRVREDRTRRGRPQAQIALAAALGIAVLAIGAFIVGSGPTVTTSPSPSLPTPTASPSASAPSVVMPLDLPIGELLYSCGDDIAFAAAALFGPLGAELAPTGPATALRVFLAQDGVEVNALPDAGWRLVDESPDVALFIAGDPQQDGDLQRVIVERSAEGWKVGGWGGCRPIVVLGGGLGTAEWILDPAAPRPGPESRTFTALVTERSCSSGRSPDGRIAPPFFSYGTDAILVVFGVRPLPGNRDCPGAPPGRVVFELREPIGDRRLLDGAFYPPRDPLNPAEP